MTEYGRCPVCRLMSCDPNRCLCPCHLIWGKMPHREKGVQYVSMAHCVAVSVRDLWRGAFVDDGLYYCGDR